MGHELNRSELLLTMNCATMVTGDSFPTTLVLRQGCIRCSSKQDSTYQDINREATLIFHGPLFRGRRCSYMLVIPTADQEKLSEKGRHG